MQLYPARTLERAMKIMEVITRADERTDQLDAGGRDPGDIGSAAAAVADTMGGTRLRRIVRPADAATESEAGAGVKQVEEVLRLYREGYFDFNVKHLSRSCTRSIRSISATRG